MSKPLAPRQKTHREIVDQDWDTHEQSVAFLAADMAHKHWESLLAEVVDAAERMGWSSLSPRLRDRLDKAKAAMHR